MLIRIIKRPSFIYQRAEINDLNCLEGLGDMYLEGLEVDKDNEKALYYYLKSAEEGNAKAYYKIGKLYEEEKNYEMALVNYLKVIIMRFKSYPKTWNYVLQREGVKRDDERL